MHMNGLLMNLVCPAASTSPTASPSHAHEATVASPCWVMPLQTLQISFPPSFSLSCSSSIGSGRSSSSQASPCVQFHSRLDTCQPAIAGGTEIWRIHLDLEVCYLEGRAVDVAVVAVGLDVNPEIAARDATTRQHRPEERHIWESRFGILTREPWVPPLPPPLRETRRP
jgi:hypothetical protein